MSALKDSRPIDLTITGVTANPTVDALKSLTLVIEGFEARVAAGETFAALAGGEDIVVLQTGDNPYVIHKWQVVQGSDLDASPPVYVIDYVGSAADVAGLPATPTPPNV
jgi:hypothetical protein